MADHQNPKPAGPLSLEGRLLAHRKLLAFLVARLPPSDQRAVLDWLEERSVYQDGQEDPGAVPGSELALEYALADEFRQLARSLDSKLP